jgi:hypothetical protein
MTNNVIGINNLGTGGDIYQPHNMGSITWFSGSGVPTAAISAIRNTPASGNNVELRFTTAASGVQAERMVITATGNVGIGTNTPYGKLHLTGDYDGAQNTLNLENNWPNTHRTSLIRFWAYYNASNPMAIIEGGQDESATNAGQIVFKTMLAGAAPAERMRITPSGNVLINTTTDSGERLYVSGSGRFVNQLRAYSLLSDNEIKGSAYVELSPDQTTYNAWNIRVGAQAADACYYITGGGVNILTTEGYNNPYTVKLYSNGVQTLTMTNGASTFSSSVTANARSFIKGSAGYLFDVEEQGSNKARFQSYVVSNEVSLVAGYDTTAVPMTFYTGGGERMRITSGGNVGIGTSAPVSLLNLNNGDAWINVVSQLRGLQFGYAGPTHGSYRAAVMGGAESYGGTDSGMLTFHTQNGYVVSAVPPERMRLTSDGNLGIGTSAPNLYSWASRTLTVVSSATNTYAALEAYGNGTGAGALLLGNTSILRASIVGADGSHLVFATNTANTGSSQNEKMRITNTGNIGIATSAPVTKVTVGAYEGSRLPYINGTATTFNADGITVTSYNTGNTGIGGGLDLTNNVHSIGSFSPVISFSALSQSGNYNNNYAAIYGVLAGDSGDGNWNSGHLVFATAFAYGASEKMRITNSGNVGIGTTTPSYKLTVNESATNPIAYFGTAPLNASSRNALIILQSGTIPQSGSDTTGEVGFLFKHSYGTGGVNGTANGGYIESIRESVFGITSQVNTALIFGTSSANVDGERMRITSTGYVGIGTTAPSDELTVNSAGNSTGIAIQRSGVTKGLLEIGSSSDTFAISATSSTGILTFATNSSERMRIGSDGSVSINNTMNYGKLNIIGYDNGGINIIDQRTSSGSGVIFKSGITFRDYYLDSSASIDFYHNQFYGAGVNRLGFSFLGSEKMSIVYNGNVGIGTTSPQSRIDLSPSLAQSTVGTLGYSANASLNIRIPNSVGDIGQIVFTNDAAPTAGYASIGVIMTSGAGVGLGDIIFSTKPSGSDAASLERMRVTSAGDVGIGTSAPSYKLHVSGTIGLTDDLTLASTNPQIKWSSGILRFTSLGIGNVVFSIAQAGAATFTSSVTATGFFESSDARLKTIVNENYRLDSIVSIKPKFYEKNGKFEVGYIAQEVEQLYPHAVTVGADGYLSLSYSQVHTLKLAYLEDSIEEIKRKIAYLEQQLNNK